MHRFTFTDDEVFQLLQAADERILDMCEGAEKAALTNAATMLANVQQLINDRNEVPE